VSNTIEIGKRLVGIAQPAYVIAEAGVNHNGDIGTARRLVDAAAKAGADAVKFQTFITERLVTRTAPKAEYQHRATLAQESQFDLLSRLQLSAEAHRELLFYADECGVQFLSTPFDSESADFLEAINVAAFKVGSGELTDLPLLAHIARKRKPIILSTGMSWIGEVERALRTIYEAAPDPQIALMHCVSNYPTNAADVNLRAIDTLRQAFDLPVGYSDHTLGLPVPLAAVGRGACIIEKHLTLDRELPGPDHRVSLEPSEFGALVRGIREVEAALGDGVKRPRSCESDVRAVARKSITTLVEIPSGCRIDREMLGVRRPGTGIPPGDLELLIGRTTRQDVPADTQLTWGMLA